MFGPREYNPKASLSTPQRIAVIVLDIFMLAEVAVAVYLANLNPDNYTPTFMKAFFGMLIPTLVVGLTTIRLLRAKPAEQAEQ